MERVRLLPGRDFDLPDSFNGQTAVVTGSTSGLGFALARHLVSGGAHVVVSGRSQDRSARIAANFEEIALAEGSSGRATGVAVDISDFAGVRRFASEVGALFPEVNLLVLNAAINYGWLPAVAEAMNASDFVAPSGHDRAMATNYLGHFLLLQLLARHLAETARIVIVGSPAAWAGDSERWVHMSLPHLRVTWEREDLRRYAFLEYCDTKLAGTCFARALRKRAAQAKKRWDISHFVPGCIDTALGYSDATKGESGISRKAVFWGWHAPAEAEAVHLLQAAYTHVRPLPDVTNSFAFPDALFLDSLGRNRLPRHWQHTLAPVFVYLERLTFGLHASVGPACNDSLQDWLWDVSANATGVADNMAIS